jgi:hypothetical protein
VSILWLHALAFHGLQAAPLVAWLLEQSDESPARARRWVHAAGMVWLAAVVMLGWQTASGRGAVEASLQSGAYAGLLATWSVVAVYAFRRAMGVMFASPMRETGTVAGP